jgi:hypothetical protein
MTNRKFEDKTAIYVKVSKADNDRLSDEAHEHKMTKSEYIRMVLKCSQNQTPPSDDVESLSNPPKTHQGGVS